MFRRLLLGITAVACCLGMVAGCGKSTGNVGEDDVRISAMDLVAGGTVMRSTNYRLVLTTGQGPGGNRVMVSSQHRLQSGIVGSTQ